MDEFPKINKNVEDLRNARRKRQWRKILSSAVATVATSFAFGAQAPLPGHASAQPPTVANATAEGGASPAPLVFQRNDIRDLRLGQHESHESHASHASHASHYSSSD